MQLPSDVVRYVISRVELLLLPGLLPGPLILCNFFYFLLKALLLACHVKTQGYDARAMEQYASIRGKLHVFV